MKSGERWRGVGNHNIPYSMLDFPQSMLWGSWGQHLKELVVLCPWGTHTLHVNSQCVWSRKLQGDGHGSGSWRTVKNYRGEKSGQEITAEGNEAEASKQGTGQAGRSWWLRKSIWEGTFPPDCRSSKIFHFQVNCSWTVGAFEKMWLNFYLLMRESRQKDETSGAMFHSLWNTQDTSLIFWHLI